MDSYEGIVEGGVVKFVGPVSLPDQTKVHVLPTVPALEAIDDSDGELAKLRRANWEKLFKDMKADPDCLGPADGWSGADHDEILYGGPNGPA